jgi:hypothetical protein
MSTTYTPRFELGAIRLTFGAKDVIEQALQEPDEFLRRHHAGDWGDMTATDKQANDSALVEDTRIFSAYHTILGVKLWVITEADRSATTVLLPEEY